MAGTAKAATALSMLHTGARSLHKGQLPSPNEGSAGLGLGSVTHITELSDDDFSEGDEDGEFDYAVQASDLMHCVFLFLEPKDIIEASFSCTAWLVAASRVPVDTHFVREDDTLEWWESMYARRWPKEHSFLSRDDSFYDYFFLYLRRHYNFAEGYRLIVPLLKPEMTDKNLCVVLELARYPRIDPEEVFSNRKAIEHVFEAAMSWLYTARLAVESAREHMASIEEDGKVSIRRRSTAMVLPSPKAGAGGGGGGAPTLQRKNSVGFGGGTTPRNENGQSSQIGARDRLMLEVDTWALIVDSVSFLNMQFKHPTTTSLITALKMVDLDAVKRCLLQELLDCMKEVDSICEEAQWSCKYLEVAEEHLEAICIGESLEDMTKAIPTIVRVCRLLWKSGRYYSEGQNMQRLLQRIGNALSSTIREKCDIKDLYFTMTHLSNKLDDFEEDSSSESEEEKPRNLLSRRPGLTVDTSGAGSGKDEGKGSGEIAFHYEEEDVGSELVKAIEDSLKLIDIWTTMIEQSSIVEWSELNSAINARVEFVKARLLEIKEMILPLRKINSLIEQRAVDELGSDPAEAFEIAIQSLLLDHSDWEWPAEVQEKFGEVGERGGGAGAGGGGRRTSRFGHAFGDSALSPKMIGRRISTTNRASHARLRLKSSGLGIDEILLVNPYSEKRGLQRAWQMSHASFMFCLRELLPNEQDESESEQQQEGEEENCSGDESSSHSGSIFGSGGKGRESKTEGKEEGAG